MAIDLGRVGHEGKPVERRWTSKDALLYAIGVGAGTEELPFTTEGPHEQRVLPTFAVLLGDGSAVRDAGLDVDPLSLVHGEQGIELFGPLPAEGGVRTQSRVAGIYDKGSGALIVTESESRDLETGELRFRSHASLFLRGQGGFGGERGESGPKHVPPEREPDFEVSYPTRPDQALLYRLSGDLNPLHSDPAFAERAGFPRPILHGLCTYGFTGRALLHALCGGDPARFRSMEGRFSKPVFPGETLTVQIWAESGEAVFQTRSSSGELVFTQGRCVYRD